MKLKLNKDTLLVATTNPGKKKEIKENLDEQAIQVLSLEDLSPEKIFPEKEKTFCDNARGKSLFYRGSWEGLTLGEDSGLEIDYLDGEPGIMSARFSGPGSSDEANINRVLGLMKGVPSQKRTARFVCCMVLSEKGKILLEIEEHVHGIILEKPQGRRGFGYDPIFYHPPSGKTFAELLPKEKNEASHRGKALKKLKIFLKSYYSE
jgi:XTP/dITP diphosphohydrolase